MFGQPWEDHWVLVNRKLADVKRVYPGQSASDRDDVRLKLRLLLESIVHLEDWVANGANDVTDKQCAHFVNSNRDLRLCVDLGNGSKHMVLDKTPRSGKTPPTVGNNVIVSLETQTASYRFYVKSGRKKYDPLKIAIHAVELWREFLKGHGLIQTGD
jgi:hypothetical protein